MNKFNRIKCLFGYHDYTIRSNVSNSNKMICCLCHQYAHLKFPNGYEEWCEFDGIDWVRYQYRLPESGVIMRLNIERGWYQVGKEL